MSILTVKLRVVGIYFNREIKFEGGANPTILTLLEAAKNQFPINRRGGIDYIPTRTSPPSLVCISHNYPGRYDYDGDGSIDGPQDGLTLSGNHRMAGIYSLAEQAIEGGVIGWQHYVVRDGQLVSKTPPSRGFQSFAVQQIQNGDEVTLRLVAIGLQPTAGSHRQLRISAK